MRYELKAGERGGVVDPRLVRGEGRLSLRSVLVPGCQLRRFTARGLLGLSAEMDFFIHKHHDGQQHWIFPKYDIDHFHPRTMDVFWRVMHSIHVQEADLQEI